MVDVVVSTMQLLAALALVFTNGFFVAAEFAYVRVRSSTVDQLADSGKPGAAALTTAVDNLDDYLAVTQLGITISSIGLGWIGEPAVAALIEPILASLVPSGVVHILAFTIGFGFVTFMHVVFGELAPKTIAIARAERIALLVSPPMRICYYLFVPGIVVLNGTANSFTRLIGVPPASETEETFTEEEILTVLSRSGQKGAVDREEVEMIERVFELDDTSVREVMVPRPDVVTVSADLPLADLRSLIVEEGHTRYPVVDADDGDQAVGFVDVKDVLGAVGSDVDDGTLTAGDLARDVPIVPETGGIDDLLADLQARECQIAAVIDEFGSFQGIATIEDIVEQIVGNIRDEFDVDEREPTIESHGDGTYTVDGGIPLSEVEDALGTEFDVEGVGTLGGLVLDNLGRAPEVGDQISIDGYRLAVDRVDGARISSVVVSEARPDGESPE